MKTRSVVRLVLSAAALFAAAFGAVAAPAQGASDKPIIILKLDDFTPRGSNPEKGQVLSDNFRRTIDFLRKRKVHFSLGIVCNSLETASNAFCDWIREAHKAGDIQFWFHGWDHREYPKENGRRVTEFCRRSYELQKEAFDKSQALAEKRLGFRFKSFGAPFNQTDNTTAKIMKEHPEITTWLFGPNQHSSDACRVLERRLDLEIPVMRPNADEFIRRYKNYGTLPQYLILQGHPNAWGGKIRPQFTKIVDFLLAEGCTFMTPEEFRAVPLRDKSLPWPKRNPAEVRNGSSRSKALALPANGTGSEYGGVKGVGILGENPLKSLEATWNQDKFTVTPVEVKGEPFSDAVRIEVKQKVPSAWELQVRSISPYQLQKGDVLLLTFWMRGVRMDTEFAETSCISHMQLNRAPRTKVFSFRHNAKVGDGWIKVQKVIVSPCSLPGKQYVFSFQFGFDPQVFEIGGLSLYNYGQTVDPNLLPRTEDKLYSGHEENAPWRAKALARIERIRKGDMEIAVTDAADKPLPNAEVTVEMTRHAFGWGASMYAWLFGGNDENAKKYRGKFLELFNLTVPETGLKWNAWENPKAQALTLEMIDWAIGNGCEVRGHTLVWPSFGRNPKHLETLKDNPEALRAAIKNHMTDVMTKTRGKIRAWDIMNEPTTNFDFMKILGESEPAVWFKDARALDPKAQLFLNENQVLAGTKLRSLEVNLDRIIENGGPLGGIGIQGHLGVGTAAPEKILEIFDRLSKYKVPLSITELDVLSDNQKHQAMYLRDVLIAAFSHPSVDSVTFWGFWDGRHWKGNTPLYTKDWKEKPGLEVYRKLVLGDWWTRETVKTDAKGKARVRGFFGDYRIASGGQTIRAKHLRSGTTVNLSLK